MNALTHEFVLLAALAALPGAHAFETKLDGAWRMGRGAALALSGKEVSSANFDDSAWLPAVVPGTVLGTLVGNKILPDPYWGENNRKEKGLIPDLAAVGRDYYTAWFRTQFKLPKIDADTAVWLRPEGINYRSEIWLNGSLVACTAGMYSRTPVDITPYVRTNAANCLAVKVFPVDFPGETEQKKWGAPGEWRNGGDGEIGRNVTMLMCAGWDFTFSDGIRDRNTGIWKDIRLFTTGTVKLDNPFVRTRLSADGSVATLEIEVEVANAARERRIAEGVLKVKVEGTDLAFERKVRIARGLSSIERFTAKIRNPKLWWPRNKGPQNLYRARFSIDSTSFSPWDAKRPPARPSHAIDCQFGIREAFSDQSGKDGARQFWVNGRKIFIRGTNWIPEAMLKGNDARMEAEIRLLAESGVNLVRLWGGGIVESDRFYELCDRYGILVWQEFWMTGDTTHPDDEALYLANVAAAVRRIRTHPSLCHYVCSNESTEVAGIRELLERLDGTRSYMMQSECDGVHDGSPYKIVNPMRYYEDSASDRGSRAYGFNPEYGTCALPDADYLRSFMPENLLWPIDRAAWKYREGGGFDDMTTVHDTMVRAYGEPKSLEDYCRQSEAVDAMNHRALWEVWNRASATRRATGVLFWYANTPVPKIGSHAWDHSLGLTSAFFAQKSALAPLHAQYDYLDDTVSVMNDTPRNRTVEVRADVYDFQSRRLSSQTVKASVPAETCLDLSKLKLPDGLTPVHFIRLALRENGREVDSTVYWRSTSAYTGQKRMDGPTTAGFESMGSLPKTELAVRATPTGRGTRFEIRNVGNHLAFLVKVSVSDVGGRVLKPAFYTDNWMNLMPGETRTVEVEHATAAAQWMVRPWNGSTVKGALAEKVE